MGTRTWDAVKYFLVPDPAMTFALVVVAAFLITTWVVVLRIAANIRPNRRDGGYLTRVKSRTPKFLSGSFEQAFLRGA